MDQGSASLVKDPWPCSTSVVRRVLWLKPIMSTGNAGSLPRVAKSVWTVVAVPFELPIR